MGNKQIETTVEEITRPVVDGLALELVDVRYVKEGGRWYLRVFIDKPGGVTLDDCQAVSERLDGVLDHTNPIPGAYTLEVSSPGLARCLKKPADFQRFRGHLVRLTTFAPLSGRKRFTGRLCDLAGETVILEVDGMQVMIPLKQVAAARLEVEF